MKIACLQFAPQVGQVEENIRKADEILQHSSIPLNLDWLVLPEMAFSGYNFQSAEEIKPFLEPTAAGVSTQWAIQVATHYRCHVTVGYPEITTAEPKKTYNSTVTISPSGMVINNYRKTFLYYTDETWSCEGPSQFFSGQLGTLGQVTLGICMDINPYKFTAPWTDYEFATAAIRNESPLVCVSMAWLGHLSPEELEQDPCTPDYATLAYWMERFQPFVERAAEHPMVIILANRCGVEKGVCYAGSSTVVRIDATGVSLYDSLGKNEQKCLIVDTIERPKFSVRSGV